MKTEISAGCSRKINLGNYESIDIWFSLKEEHEIENPEQQKEFMQKVFNKTSYMLDQEIKKIQSKLK